MIGSLPRYTALVKIAQKRTEFRDFSRSLTFPQIQTFLGMMGHILPIAYKKAYSNFKGKKGRRSIDDRKLQELMQKKEVHKGLVATTGMEKYLKAHCPGAYHSRPTLIKYRRLLEVLGLFRVAFRTFGDKRFPTEYQEIDLAEALLFCEALEEELLDRMYCGGGCPKRHLEALPKHKYFSLVRMFNLVFRPFNLSWRRVWEDEPIFGALLA